MNDVAAATAARHHSRASGAHKQRFSATLRKAPALVVSLTLSSLHFLFECDFVRAIKRLPVTVSYSLMQHEIVIARLREGQR
ncbi:MAG: hypothetical protein WD118_10820 [Phycisphaeraceae bacterium]